MPITVTGRIGLHDPCEHEGESRHHSCHPNQTAARAFEASGFDRLLLPFDVSNENAWPLLQQMVSVTNKIGFVLHDASMASSLDRLPHRTSAPDGRVVQYLRSASHSDGKFGAETDHTDLVALTPGSLREITQEVRALRRAAGRVGQSPAFVIRVHPVLVAGQHDTLRCVHEAGPDLLGNSVQNGAIGLVGTPHRVARALLDYYDIGIEHVILDGFDPTSDAIGRDLIPVLRRKVAQRDALLNMLAG